MKPRLVGIDVHAMTDDQVFSLVNSIRLVWPVGPGNLAKFFEDYRIRPTDMLRLVLGVPTAWLTPDRIAYGNAMHQLALGRPAAWTRKPGWAPTNPRSVASFDSSCVLDPAFLSRFAFTDAEWGVDVFRAPDFLKRSGGADRLHLQARAYVALRLFGFTAPESFFMQGETPD